MQPSQNQIQMLKKQKTEELRTKSLKKGKDGKKGKFTYTPIQYHGMFACDAKGIKSPKCTFYSEELARGVKYGNVNPHTKSEFLDDDKTLKIKVKILADMIRNTECQVMYAGAGISVNAGINDYASSLKGKKKKKIVGGMKKRPTFAHHAIAAMHLHPKKFIKHFCQQNHDGLAQKAGYPQSALNEIHGTWHDKTYRVIKMNESLRPENFETLQQWAIMSDLTIAVGTSLSGMCSDMTATQPIEKFLSYGKGQGLAIINLQMTRLHQQSSLNIFGDIDKVFKLLVEELGIKMPSQPRVFMNKKDWRK